MSVDPGVLAALKAAVENDPSNAALRLHYAGLLQTANLHQEALDQCAAVLVTQPDHLEALKLGATSAEAAGDKIRAHGYRNLYDALSMNKAKNLIESVSFEEPPAALPARDEPTPFDDDFDEEDEPRRLRLGGDEDDTEGENTWRTERPEITLADVAGMDQVKRRLNVAFLGPMRNPELRKLYGKSLKGGLLLYGPPGCGKTYIARAVAGELGAKFLSIGLTDVVDMWLGESEKNLHEIFQTARRNKPCVLFIDELDALGRKRSLMRHHAGTSLINQLLSELDGVEFDNDGLYILAATNHPWDVDSALRRPGRLDRMVLVLPPDAAARQAIIKSSMKERPAENIDDAGLAQKIEDFSGADVVHLCDSAAELALEDSIATGTTRPIMMRDFKEALKDVKPSTRSWFETAKNHALYANEGGIYDDLLEHLRKRRML
jgi:SpoVK/Ycf46/Vps4 family AAA+-type ATPase